MPRKAKRTQFWCGEIKWWQVSLLVAAMLVLTCCAPTLRSLDRFTTKSSDNKVVMIRVFGEVCSEWYRGLDEAMDKGGVKVVVMWVESPGGSVTESRLLYHNLGVVRAKHPDVAFWVYSQYVLASGAYWAFCGADSIWNSPVCVVGSIGAYSVRVDSSKADSIAGVNWIYTATSSNKVRGGVHVKVTLAELMGTMMGLSEIYADFLNTVYANRFEQLAIGSKLTEFCYVDDSCAVDSAVVGSYLFSIGNGSVFVGQAAMNVGLTDGVAYFDEFIQMLISEGYRVETVGGEQIHDFWPGECK